MTQILRRSPVSFTRAPVRTERRNGWDVVLQYEGEGGTAPRLIDLSHRSKWDAQHRAPATLKPWGLRIPKNPGECIYQGGMLINRMNRTQASCWHLDGEAKAPPDGAWYTDTGDASALLALVGGSVFSIMEKACSLDFNPSKCTPPCLFQAPLFHVPSQIVYLGVHDGEAALLLSCSRGYGHTVAEALLHGGAEWGLGAAGEDAFRSWLTATFS